MLVKLNSREVELAAEKYYLVHNFLELKGLECEKYYDAVLDGFLNAVSIYCQSSGDLPFNEIAFKEMNSSCLTMLSNCESEVDVHCSLDDCLENGLPIEKAVADTIDVARQAINAINFEETLKGFDVNERRIAELLLEGYTERNIAELLNMNLLSVFHYVESICIKISGTQVAMAA